MLCYQEEINQKKLYLELIIKRHPEIEEYLDPAYDIHNLQLSELRARVTG